MRDGRRNIHFHLSWLWKSHELKVLLISTRYEVLNTQIPRDNQESVEVDEGIRLAVQRKDYEDLHFEGRQGK